MIAYDKIKTIIAHMAHAYSTKATVAIAYITKTILTADHASLSIAVSMTESVQVLSDLVKATKKVTI